MTEPLTPADCDLRDFAFMPLDVVRLRDSDLAIHVSGEEFRSAVLLWCASWHQVPAASLPDDDKTLAALAGYGRVVAEWKKVRDGALRGWITCSDGRLYHPVVAEKAREAWRGKHQHAYEKLGDRVRKANKSRREKGLPQWQVPSFDDWISAGMPLERQLFPPESDDGSGGNDGDFRRKGTEIPPENPLKGEGQGHIKEKEEGGGDSVHRSTREETTAAAAPPGAMPPDPFHGRACELTKLLRTRGAALQASDPRVRRWAETGITDAQALLALETAQQRREDQANPQPIGAGYLDAILSDQRAQAAPQPKAPKEPVDTWWLSDAGIERKGRELGLFARANEDHKAFKDRIFQEIRRRDGKKAA